MPKRKLFAVLVGINDYQFPVGKLNGPTNDVKKWKEYLKIEEANFDVEIAPPLINAKATKDNIVDALSKALDQAQENDVVLFFYAGHGAREKAPSVFERIEQDNALEVFVCYDSITKSTEGRFVFNLLADKEIHYLLHSKAKDGTHVVFITDSCHSGGITRNAFLPGVDGLIARRFVPEARMGIVAPMRSWDDFLFGNIISEDEVNDKGWFNTFPQKPHIAFSACQNDESAYEYGGTGVFTSSLIQVLTNTKGNISYYHLEGRIRNFVRNQLDQTPNIYSTRNNEDDLLKYFLDKTNGATEFFGQIFYKDNLWVIDHGALHGLSSFSGPVEIRIEDKVYEVDIDKVFAYYCSLDLSQEILDKLEQHEMYEGKISNLTNGVTSFYVESTSSEQEATEIKNKIDQFIENNKTSVFRSDSSINAPYIITPETDLITVRFANDEAFLPAVQVEKNDPLALDRLIQYMRHISKWEFVKNHQNPDLNIASGYPVTIHFYNVDQDGNKNRIEANKNEFILDYIQNSDGTHGGNIKIEIRNQSQAKYHCALLYLSNQFQVYGNLLDGKVIPLNPGESAWVFNGENIELTLEDHVREFNFKYSKSTFKLIANLEPFSIRSMEQAPLPAPSKSRTRGTRMAATRGIVTKDEAGIEPIQWFTNTVELKIKNPKYIQPELA